MVPHLRSRWAGPRAPAVPGGARSALSHVAGVACLLRCVRLGGHSRPMTEDEAKAVAAVAAQCVTWRGWRRWGLVMRYGRLFTPGTDAFGGIRIRGAASDGRNAYRRAVDSGLLYAEGYACLPLGERVPLNRAWCLDGETVVDPAGSASRAPRTSGWRCGPATCGGSMRHSATTTAATGSCGRSPETSGRTRRWTRPPTSSWTSAGTFRPRCVTGP